MPTKNADKATSRYLSYLRRIQDGLELQHVRCTARADNAEQIVGAINYGTDPGVDLDHYAFELVRLMDTAESLWKSFNKPVEVREAIDRFLLFVPFAREIRNSLTHMVDRDDLDDVAHLSSIYRLNSDLSATELIDPAYQQYEEAIRLCEWLQTYLRQRLQESIQASPPALPIDEQIKRRNAG